MGYEGGETSPTAKSIATEYIFIVGLIGLAVLLLAAVNFANLTTARSLRRMKEIGVRKFVGAARFSLIKLFISEAVIMSLVAVLIGVALAELFLPVFNLTLGKEISINYFGSDQMLLVMFIVGLLVGCLAGSYPALFLSSFNPISALKNDHDTGVEGMFVRKGLIVMQFIVVTFLLVSIISLRKQFSYMAAKDMGYDYKNMLTLRVSDKMVSDPRTLETFINELRASSSIASVYATGRISYENVLPGGSDPDTRMGTLTLTGDYEFLRSSGSGLLAGRFPSEKNATDVNSVLINETALEVYGWTPREAIGKTLDFSGGKNLGANETTQLFTIVGVVKDIYTSFTRKNMPVCFRIINDGYSSISVLARPGQTANAVSSIKNTWKRVDDGWPFDVVFESESLRAEYAASERIATLMTQLTYLGTFIACMGLFGIAAYSAERRTKEIGIRKVLGATVVDVWRLMVSEFALLIIIATVLGCAIGSYMVKGLLASFIFQTDIGISVYFLAFFLTVVIAVATVSYQAIKSARLNPVKSLKSE